MKIAQIDGDQEQVADGFRPRAPRKSSAFGRKSKYSRFLLLGLTGLRTVQEFFIYAKNVLTVVQSFAQQSFDGQETAAQSFIGRLTALSQTHTLLAESRWEGARLDDLLESIFDPYRGPLHPRINYSGPVVQLPPKAAQGLALAFHELVLGLICNRARARSESDRQRPRHNMS